jgi:hypothetical protein
MGIMTGSTPHLCAAFDLARTQCQLLGVTDYLERSFRTCWRLIMVDGECLFQPLSRFEVGEPLARIHNSRHAHEVALFAYAVSRPGFQACRIDDVLRSRLRQMGDCGAMAPVASNRKVRERYFAIVVL